MRTVNINKAYKHYKGKIYFLMDVATHSETGEKMVVYTDGVNVWCRPYDMFYENVEVNGELVPRFKRVSTSSNMD